MIVGMMATAVTASAGAAATGVVPVSEPDSAGPAPLAGDARAFRLAVLGDSDSHAYRDPVAGGAGTAGARGGDWQDTTLQWTEILARLRGDQVDQGALGVVGRQGPLAWLLRRTGFGPVRQHKQDFRFNLAYNGARCADLVRPDLGQARVLAKLMDEEPAAWRQRAAVVIRIGINDLGQREPLNRFVETGLDADAQRRVAGCLRAVEAAIEMLRARHPEVGLAIVGILDNVDWPPLHDRWHDPAALGRITKVLDAYDHGLRDLADRHRGVFLDDRAQFRAWFGGRSSGGEPAYRRHHFGGDQALTMSQGDASNHAVLADGHAGTIWNGWWANGLVSVLNRHFAAGIRPIGNDELLRLADPQNRAGLRPR